MGPYLRTSAMNQIFLWSALTRSSRLANGTIQTSSAFTDPAVLAFWASLECGVFATLHIARAFDLELGIVAAVCMSRLGNVFTCLLGVLNELLSSGPTKASTASMNAGIGSSYSSRGCCRRIVSFINI